MNAFTMLRNKLRKTRCEFIVERNCQRQFFNLSLRLSGFPFWLSILILVLLPFLPQASVIWETPLALLVITT